MPNKYIQRYQIDSLRNEIVLPNCLQQHEITENQLTNLTGIPNTE